ncbi:hypothetical protein PsAD2_02368 [Pseudovibrio axinellae]|uniref:DUF2946 domain-containing protein n=1 Tax=Pseudovibrio axinellae TaxID=989403 RepID=A0A165YHR8_9HYPH|nr:hypothetical protein [Pseudovibrio axinellae]KZL18852.1 hypothetical protein PsAD2_02368 [Pseudovibrio axinellae]SEP90310.1 hypothetical protein SAMN05421798_101673 [Pseudovibrio axinellae]
MVKPSNTLQVLRSERHPLVLLASIAMLARVLLLALSLSGAAVDPAVASLGELCTPSGSSHIAKVEGSTHSENPLGVGCDCSFMCPHTSKQASYFSFEPETWKSPSLVVAGSLSLDITLGNARNLRGHNFHIRAPPVS